MYTKKKMLWQSILLCVAIFVIAVINYFDIMFYIIFGLLMLCGTSFGPAIIFYIYARLSPLYSVDWKYTLTSVGSILIMTFYYFNLLIYLIFGLLIVCGMLLSPTIVLYIHNYLSAKHSTNKSTKKIINNSSFFDTLLNCKLKEYYINHKIKRDNGCYPLIFSRLVDGALLNLLDLIFRDFISFWLNDIAIGADELINTAKQDLWETIQKIHSRTEHINHTNLVACGIVNTITFHFEKIRLAQEAAADKENPDYILSPHLMSDKSELEYLRKVSEVFIILFMPSGYTIPPVICLLKEVLTCRILKPVINAITDPDYINQKILLYIQQQKMTEALHKKSCEYADSFEDFLSMIKSTRDLEVLKRIRYNIVTEIMQATTSQNVQRSQGLDSDGTGFGKSDTTHGRKLKRYISQLTYAKNTCECHMQSLGWDGYPMEDDDVIDPMATPENRIIPLKLILESVIGRKYLSQFLEQASSQGLIGYWAAVQELRATDKSNWHQLGAEIFYTYIAIPTAEIKVDKDVKKRMEGFLMGDKGPDVFYEVQDIVVQTLEDKYYPSFIISEQYKKLTESINDEKLEISSENRRSMINGTISSNTLLVGEHSSHSRNKLDQLQEKLNNKMQALKALQSSLKPENKVLSILAKEVEWLHGEKRQLEAHLNHTETWAEHLGHWRADVQSAETPDNGDPPEFVLVVHMVSDNADEANISTGWVVLRKLQEFQDLHRKLRQLCSSVKSLELPSQPLKFFGKTDKNALDKARAQIQKYLNFVLEDDRLNQSEALYAFLSPSSERLKHSTPSPKKSRFSLSTLFKSSSGSSGDSREKDDEEDLSLLLDDNEPTRSVTDAFFGLGKDSIAEPLYALIGEIFDLSGVFRWLRRSLITFVQLTYGRTINRQVRETVTWMFSEPMLHYYIQLLTKSWWPNGKLVTEVPIRMDEDKSKTHLEARQEFLNNVPDFLTVLVGAQSAQRGATKVFDALQNVKLNKQLFYDIFEVVMYDMFPNFKQSRD